jgi:hypothetical protein
LKWQLSRSEFLVPISYTGLRLDSNTKRWKSANIHTDYLTYFDKTLVKEVFQVGFGDLCWVLDQLIKPINQLINNEKTELPIAVNRLPKSRIYFPKFYSGDLTFFDYNLPNVGNCNRHSLRKLCKSMPLTQPFTSTANGRRQLFRFKFDENLDLSYTVLLGENIYYNFMIDMLNAQYCSPYI